MLLLLTAQNNGVHPFLSLFSGPILFSNNHLATESRECVSSIKIINKNDNKSNKDIGKQDEVMIGHQSQWCSLSFLFPARLLYAFQYHDHPLLLLEKLSNNNSATIPSLFSRRVASLQYPHALSY